MLSVTYLLVKCEHKPYIQPHSKELATIVLRFLMYNFFNQFRIKSLRLAKREAYISCDKNNAKTLASKWRSYSTKQDFNLFLWASQLWTVRQFMPSTKDIRREDQKQQVVRKLSVYRTTPCISPTSGWIWLGFELSVTILSYRMLRSSKILLIPPMYRLNIIYI